MDQLYQRYADPFSFITGMIQTGRFNEFVDKFIEKVGKDREDKLDWEFYLHKVWEGTFEEFKREIEINKENQRMSKRTIETTVQDSMDILNNFNPEEGGEN